ncbi:prenyltransferase, partial [Chloroflexota bacterium]
LNEYHDYITGVDLHTIKTPFSGGSGILPAGLLRPKQALWFGLITFLMAVPIGIYFVIVKGIYLLPLLIVGAVCILLYTPIILKVKWPEWSPGVGLGTLPVLGAYFIQTGFYTIPAIIASIPSGILVHNLLLLNEFPDTEADMRANKKTSPITMGKKKAGVVYSFMTLLVYLWIIGGVVAGQIPLFALIALLTLPFGIKAIRGSLKSDDMNKFMPAMANNVLVVLLTQLLLGIGYILARVIM